MIGFKHPFTCIVSGPTGSGKSSFCIQFLRNLTSLCTEQNFSGGKIWCYSERAAVPSQQLAVLRKNIRFYEGVHDNFDNARGEPCLVNINYLLNGVYSKELSVLFTRELSQKYQRDVD
jgi:GTPase SAR1 family protein